MAIDTHPAITSAEERRVLEQCEAKIKAIAAKQGMHHLTVKISDHEVLLVEIQNCTAAISTSLLGLLKGLSHAGNGKRATFIDAEFQRLSFSEVIDLALALNANTKERSEKIDLSELQQVPPRP